MVVIHSVDFLKVKNAIFFGMTHQKQNLWITTVVEFIHLAYLKINLGEKYAIS